MLTTKILFSRNMFLDLSPNKKKELFPNLILSLSSTLNMSIHNKLTYYVKLIIHA